MGRHSGLNSAADLASRAAGLGSSSGRELSSPADMDAPAAGSLAEEATAISQTKAEEAPATGPGSNQDQVLDALVPGTDEMGSVDIPAECGPLHTDCPT